MGGNFIMSYFPTMNITICVGFLKCRPLMFLIFLQKDFVYLVDMLLGTFKFLFSL